ncbi:IS3 family transposase [Streptococcus dysgalactiae]|uniref:IS3 family transposase n=1 Tax=Streptococcus dysgalactiae TaxID=1334 RepID=UPI003D9FDDD8
MSRSTYYRWKADISQPTHHDSLVEKIENLCVKNEFIYGYRTIRDLLMNEYGIIVNVKKVYRIMKKNGWLCRTRPKKKPYYVTNNKLDSQFTVDKPLRKLVTDITYLHFGGCKLYLSSIMDLYNREIIVY